MRTERATAETMYEMTIGAEYIQRRLSTMIGDLILGKISIKEFRAEGRGYARSIGWRIWLASPAWGNANEPQERSQAGRLVRPAAHAYSQVERLADA
jgi:hypothetical protein